MSAARYSTLAISLSVALLVPGGLRAGENEAVRADEALLRDARIDPGTASLLAFFRQRTLSEGDQHQLDVLIGRLGSPRFAVREKAFKQLVGKGTPALARLRQALQDPDVEIVRRVENCIQEIERGPGPLLPVAAARLLAHRRVPGAVEVLLRYLPFADDAEVEEEVLTALGQLSDPRVRPVPCLVEALRDAHPARRAAAGYVLGRRDLPSLGGLLGKLLQDPEARVRFRTAQALIAAGRKEAVPPLIELLSTAPMEIAGRAEELLLQMAGDKAPLVTASGDTPAERKTWRAAWARWWNAEGPRLDLARAKDRPPFLNLLLVPEMHANQVWECGRDGKPRWHLTGLQQPIDARYLPGGRLLIAEVHGNQVTERDRTGKILWRYTISQPACCQRLPNGNTFIGTTTRVIEVTPAGKEVFSYSPGRSFTTNGYHRLRNGNVVLVAVNGEFREVSPAGKVVRSFQLDASRNWCGIEALPGHRYLVADCRKGEVHEVDGAGKTLWQAAVPGAYFATRLPSGNILVAHAGGLSELNRAGKVVWQKTVRTGPWLVHWR
jgi:HEAT repeat protein